jgi:small neutral amino acid transporter SnatA (MarC family)
MKNFLLAFIPLFVAVDAIGVLPMFLGLTEEIQYSRRRRVIAQSVITAATVVIVFIIVGTPLLRLLGISVSDFMIAGGGLLFVISLSAGFVFWFAAPISKLLGSAGTKTVSKIASLLLASIAVMMIRKGIVALVLQIQG